MKNAIFLADTLTGFLIEAELTRVTDNVNELLGQIDAQILQRGLQFHVFYALLGKSVFFCQNFEKASKFCENLRIFVFDSAPWDFARGGDREGSRGEHSSELLDHRDETVQPLDEHLSKHSELFQWVAEKKVRSGLQKGTIIRVDFESEMNLTQTVVSEIVKKRLWWSVLRTWLTWQNSEVPFL